MSVPDSHHIGKMKDSKSYAHKTACRMSEANCPNEARQRGIIIYKHLHFHKHVVFIDLTKEFNKQTNEKKACHSFITIRHLVLSIKHV